MSEEAKAQKYLIENQLDDLVLNAADYPNNTPDNAKKWVYASGAMMNFAAAYHQEQTKGNNLHYDSLQECCSKILDKVDAGKVPQREIMGLRILMNRDKPRQSES